MTDIKQRINASRWYCVNAIGMATLCSDEGDAKTGSKEYDTEWPRHSPHIATQLVPMALVTELRTTLEGEAAVMRSILAEADQVLSTIEPADEHEAQMLGELRRKVKRVLFPDADLSLF